MTTKQRLKHILRYHWRGILVVLTPIINLPILLFTPTLSFRMIYVFIVMMTYWYTEAAPKFVTALIPIVVFPIMGILSSIVTCGFYIANYPMCYMITMVVIHAIEYNNLHKRVALDVLSIIGYKPRIVHFGLMITTFLLTIMFDKELCPIMIYPFAKAFLLYFDEIGVKQFDTTKKLTGENSRPYPSKMTTSFYLGIAYVACAGSCITTLGSDVNATFKDMYYGHYEIEEGTDVTLKFTEFWKFNIPPAVIIFFICYFWLEIVYMGLLRPKSKAANAIKISREEKRNALKYFRQKRKEMKFITLAELFTLIYAALLVLLLFVLNTLKFQPIIFGKKIKEKKFIVGKIHESTPAVFIAFLVFITPGTWHFVSYFICRKPKKYGPESSLLPWKYFQENLRWDTMLMLGGTNALGQGLLATKVPAVIAKQLKHLSHLRHLPLMFCTSFFAVFFSAVSLSHIVLALYVPIVFEIATYARSHPLFISLPTAMCINLSFLLPTSSPANVTAADFGNIRPRQMLLAGIVPSIFSIVVYVLSGYYYAPKVFKDIEKFPKWGETDRVNNDL